MAASAEIGWQPTADEGLRLMTCSDHLFGLRATLTLPTEYASPNPWSYFNFYLGINYVGGGGAVEAGASFGWRGGVLGWRTFINPGSSKLSPGLASSLDLALFIRDSGDGSGFPVFYVNGSEPLVGSVRGKKGKVKMVAAMHEDINAPWRRKTWFNQAVFKCTGVIDCAQPASATPATVKWLPYATVPKLVWHLQRPPSVFRLISARSSSGDSYRTTMYKPGTHVPITIGELIGNQA